MEFDYAGPGLGKGGTAKLYVDGEAVGEGQVAATAAMIFSADDGCDIGVEYGALVADDYPIPNRFTGEVNWVEIDVAARPRGSYHESPTPRSAAASRWHVSAEFEELAEEPRLPYRRPRPRSLRLMYVLECFEIRAHLPREGGPAGPERHDEPENDADKVVRRLLERPSFAARESAEVEAYAPTAFRDRQ